MNLKTLLIIMLSTFFISFIGSIVWMNNQYKKEVPKNYGTAITPKSSTTKEDDGYVPPKFTTNRVIGSEDALEFAISQKFAEFEPKFRLKINVNTMDEQSIQNVFDKILAKGNHRWHVKKIQWEYSITKTYAHLITEVEYVLSSDDDEVVSEFVNQWIAQNLHQHMTPEQKIRAIHDHIVSSYRYELGDENRSVGDYSVHSPRALLENKCGVCQGYASLFHKMATEAGIETKLIVGVAGDGKSKSQNHIWNMVKLDDAWYHVDTTWDDPLPDVAGRILHQYYLRGDFYMSRTHKWMIDFYPKAPRSYRIER